MLSSRKPASGFDPAQARLSYRRNLPHLVQDDGIYFVTFRLYDSIPRSKLALWTEELQRWKKRNPLPHTPDQVEAFAELGYRRIERWIDRCEGSCLLREAAIQQIVSHCLLHRNGQDYSLGDYIIMPNHVHLLVQMVAPHKLKDIVETWYGVTTHRINKAVGRKGRLWQDEPFDHIVRSDASLLRIREYIKGNGRRLPPTSWLYGAGTLFDDVIASD